MSDDKKIIFSMVGVSKQTPQGKQIIKDILQEQKQKTQARCQGVSTLVFNLLFNTVKHTLIDGNLEFLLQISNPIFFQILLIVIDYPTFTFC